MLIICPECNHQVSDKAEICPHCGIKIAGNITTTVPTANPLQNANLQQTSIQQQPQMQPVNAASQQTYIPGNDNVSNNCSPTTPEHKKSSSKTFLVSLILAVIVCAIGYYFYSNAERQKEQEAYEYAMQSTDPMVLQNYLGKYMDAPREHRDSINAHLSMLQNEEQEWQDALNSGLRGELVKYVENNPDSPHISEARDRIDSIDYFKAEREYKNGKSIEALEKYLKEHPNGKYANIVQDLFDNVKDITVSTEETAMARDACRRFFQAINSKNEGKLLGTVTDFLGSFLNRTGASSNEVVDFMKKLYKSDITNMNWHILDDFKAEKVDDGNGGKNIQVQFSAEQKIERTDPTKEKLGLYVITAEVSPEGKITKFNMKKRK